ncbi:transmembrane protein 45B [Hemibagrus wyckioides]|uniref:transmembrane protein 45B n=1 Tax=Hemibagrus wyckioides TaxID=337641 RepID=UPI00266B3F20|nr:transmembrane protein 45B [Hemibagrus wyckioides]
MANFKGHALPGTFFFLFGFWWSVKYPLRHSWKKKQHGMRQNLPLFFNRIDLIEGSVKIFFAFVGIMAEQFVPDGPHAHLFNGEWVKLMNWQHSTMYLFFGISGIADVLSMSSLPVPPGLDHFGLSLALFVEGFLFYFHVHSRPALDQHIHSLLLVAIFCGAASTMLEAFLQDNALLEVFRCSLAILQGTWFYQIGFVLYPLNGQEWDLENHGNIMFITMCYCWHYAVALLIVGVNYSTVWWITNRYGGKQRTDLEFSLRKTTQSDTSSQKALLQESDEE